MTGSSDDTAQIARAEFAVASGTRAGSWARRTAASGRCFNRGLASTDAEIVVRIGADCVIEPDALVCSVPWFRDPRIGSDGAIGGAPDGRRDL